MENIAKISDLEMKRISNDNTKINKYLEMIKKRDKFLSTMEK